MTTERNTPTTALSIPAAKLEALEDIASRFSLAKIANLGSMSLALTVAEGIQQLEAALTPEIMAPIMKLQGTKLGFLTDKDKDGGYPEPVVRRVVIEGLIRGVRPVLNELNIIANGFYATREAFTRLLREYPGLTDLRIDLGVPRVPKEGVGGCVVVCKGSWRLNGKTDEMAAEIPIRVNSGMGADAILGKADRKFKARIYARLIGSESYMPEGEVEEKNVTPRASASSSSGLDAFAAGVPYEDVQQQGAGDDTYQGEPGAGEPFIQQQTSNRQGEPSTATAPPPAPDYLPASRWEGLRRMAKGAKPPVTDEELKEIVGAVTGAAFNPEKIPTKLETEIVRRIKQTAAGK